MTEVINHLIDCGFASDITDAVKIIKKMKSRIFKGEDYEKVILEYGLELDYTPCILF